LGILKERTDDHSPRRYAFDADIATLVLMASIISMKNYHFPDVAQLHKVARIGAHGTDGPPLRGGVLTCGNGMLGPTGLDREGRKQ
jgi:hypothetical protein